MNTDDFDRLLAPLIRQLRAVLIARHGLDHGNDIHAEVTAYAWEHRARLVELANPAGYLYRVSQSRARRYRRWGRQVDLPAERFNSELDLEGGGLDIALGQLTADERTVAVLVHAYGYSYSEVAELVGASTSSVRNRLHRAMTKLRKLLGDDTDAQH